MSQHKNLKHESLSSLEGLADIELEKILRDHIATEDKVYIGREGRARL